MSNSVREPLNVMKKCRSACAFIEFVQLCYFLAFVCIISYFFVLPFLCYPQVFIDFQSQRIKFSHLLTSSKLTFNHVK